MRMLRKNQSLLALVLLMVMVFIVISFAAYEPFKAKLGLFDRMVCLSLLPAEGSYATLKIVRDLQMELAPSEEESKLAGIVPNLLTGGTEAENGWDAVEPKEIIFGDIAKGIIVAALEKLDKEEKLTQQHIALYEIFIEGKKEEIKEGE